MKNDDRLLTTVEAAQFLNVSKSFLDHDRFYETGKVPFCKIDPRIIRYRLSDLQRMINDRMQTK